MLWLQHLFALWVLAHMLWAAVLLQREWRRVRSVDGQVRRQLSKDRSRTLAGTEASQANTRL
jgi:hypothetical protein